jgi:opacity protein-like surface antigen
MSLFPSIAYGIYYDEEFEGDFYAGAGLNYFLNKNIAAQLKYNYIGGDDSFLSVNQINLGLKYFIK